MSMGIVEVLLSEKTFLIFSIFIEFILLPARTEDAAMNCNASLAKILVFCLYLWEKHYNYKHLQLQVPLVVFA